MFRLAIVVGSLTLARAAHAQEAEAPPQVQQLPPPMEQLPPPLGAPLASDRTPALPHAPAPDLGRPKKAPIRLELQSGFGVDRFFGFWFTRYDIALGVVVPFPHIELTPELRIQPGQSELGLISFRTEGGMTLSNIGRFRVLAGPHVAYTMILRKSSDNPFGDALLGDIGGVGLGAHAGFFIDVYQHTDFDLGLGGRATAEAFDGGAGYGATLTIGGSFHVKRRQRRAKPATAGWQ